MLLAALTGFKPDYSLSPLRNSSAEHTESAPDVESRTVHSITTNDNEFQSNDEPTLFQGEDTNSDNTDVKGSVFNNDSKIFIEPDIFPREEISKDSEVNISLPSKMNKAFSESFIDPEPEDIESLSVVGYFSNLVPSERHIPGIKTNSEKSTRSLPTHATALPIGKYVTSNRCSRGETRQGGLCVMPKIKHNIFIYSIPNRPERLRNIPSILAPEVNHNILILKLPEEELVPGPITVPPIRERNSVYVLRKVNRSSQHRARTTEPSTPQIYTVSHSEDENSPLPGGADLEVSPQSAIPTKLKIIGNESGSSAPMVSQPAQHRKKE